MTNGDGAFEAGTIAADAARAPRVEQDGREILLVELGAARERVGWLLTLNEQHKNDAVRASEEAQTYSSLVNHVAGQLAAWRLAAILAFGLAAIFGLIAFGISNGALAPQ